MSEILWTAFDRHGVQADVEELHRALDGHIGLTPEVARPELRVELIREEADELIEAIEVGDLEGAIKEMCDVLCVVYGTAVDFGVNLAPFWRVVHESNMAKRGGATRADGKHLKPEGWEPPDIAGVLADQRQALALTIGDRVRVVGGDCAGATGRYEGQDEITGSFWVHLDDDPPSTSALAVAGVERITEVGVG